MRTITGFPRKVIEHADWGVVMPDGCRLSARVWIPANAEADPVPAIVEHLPYRKRDGTTYRDCLTHPWFAGHGYACIRVDMRGNGDSEGLMDDEYTDEEWADAIAVIEWAAAQPWCNGKVGMMGISWGGFNALQVAALAPPPLKAVITLCSTVDRYGDDIHYKGGCLLGENVGWAANMLSYSSRPPDRALVGEKWRDMWLNRLEHVPDLATRWHQHQSRDAYWKRGSVCEDYAAIRAAVLAIGGWHDGYRNTVAHLVENLDVPAKGIVGPWIHKYPHYAAPQPAIGFLQEAKRWWDRWLKDHPTEVESDPAMRLWLMDAVRPAPWHPERPGRWIAEQQWPSPTIQPREFSLTDYGLSTTSGSLDRLVASPQDCGLATGEYFPFMFGPELPSDQRTDDALSTCFDTVPLRQAIDIVGAPRIRLTVAADRAQANVCVRLCDIHPDGASELISWGVLNLCQRNSRETPEPLEPGADVAVDIALDQCAYRIPAGHRLRVALSTACWPMVWPSPEAASLRLTAGSLSLPVRPLAIEDEWQFEPPEAAAPWATQQLRPSASTRRIERDVATGTVVLIVENDFGEVRDKDHGLLNGSRSREIWSISPNDPLSATVDIEWEQTGGRDDWAWRTLARTTMRCTAGNFLLNSSLEAWESDEKVFARLWEESVPRHCL
jgi:putative CocE/NonD family hydrolase